jgi:hypothetical protein
MPHTEIEIVDNSSNREIGILVDIPKTNQYSWDGCCSKRNVVDEEDIIHYKSNHIPSCINPYYICCCCNFLPVRSLDYRKVRLNKIKRCDSSGNVMSSEFNEHVIRDILLPYYDTRLKYITNTQICWSRAGNFAYTTSSILVGMASVLSFASGTYPSIHLNFVAGSLGLLALIFKEFASYSNTLDHSKIMSINKLLTQLNINHQLSDTSEDVSTLFSSAPASFVATNH